MQTLSHTNGMFNNDTAIHQISSKVGVSHYRQAYGLQQWKKTIPYSRLQKYNETIQLRKLRHVRIDRSFRHFNERYGRMSRKPNYITCQSLFFYLINPHSLPNQKDF